MKPRTNPKGTRSQPPNNLRHFVKNLAAEGFSGDVIAARLGVNKNYLRAEYALDLHAGRQIKAAKKAAAGALSKKERQRLDCIKASSPVGINVAVPNGMKSFPTELLPQ